MAVGYLLDLALPAAYWLVVGGWRLAIGYLLDPALPAAYWLVVGGFAHRSLAQVGWRLKVDYYFADYMPGIVLTGAHY